MLPVCWPGHWENLVLSMCSKIQSKRNTNKQIMYRGKQKKNIEKRNNKKTTSNLLEKHEAPTMQDLTLYNVFCSTKKHRFKMKDNGSWHFADPFIRPTLLLPIKLASKHAEDAGSMFQNSLETKNKQKKILCCGKEERNNGQVLKRRWKDPLLGVLGHREGVQRRQFRMEWGVLCDGRCWDRTSTPGVGWISGKWRGSGQQGAVLSGVGVRFGVRGNGLAENNHKLRNRSEKLRARDWRKTPYFYHCLIFFPGRLQRN